MQGILSSNWKKQESHVVLVAAGPKLGKTNFATSAPTPMIVLSFDLGELTIYPGAKRDEILVLDYQQLTREMESTGSSMPTRDVYGKLMREIQAIYKAAKSGESIKLDDGTEFPTPKSIVLDGFSRLNTMMVDGKLLLNGGGVQYTDDLSAAIRWSFWGKRGTDVYTMLQQFASLNINVIFTSWIKTEMKNDPVTKIGYETGILLPDIGGAMDRKAPGTVGSAIMCVSRGGRYYIRTKPDASTPWIGVRNRFDLPMDVDVTHGANPTGKSPWNLIFNP